MIGEVWGVGVVHPDAAKAVGERLQVRAVVRARSRAAAGRALAAAGLYGDAGRATRHLAEYGSPTGNAVELATCETEGQVYVCPMSMRDRRLLPWPPPGDA